jgi:transposase
MAESRKTYTREFKIAAVKLVTEQGRSFVAAARSLGINPGLVRKWKAALEADSVHAFPGHGHPPTPDEELRRLREENLRLKAERDILKKATAFFAGESL